MMRYLCILIFSLNLNANFLDANWQVVRFIGESHFLDPQDITEKYQSFYKGEATGTFYNCNYGGQVKTYNTYSYDEFFRNKEMELFIKYSEELKFEKKDIYVHKVSCAKTHQVIYPFVTQSGTKRAFYPFESGIFVLKYEKSHQEMIEDLRNSK